MRGKNQKSKLLVSSNIKISLKSQFLTGIFWFFEDLNGSDSNLILKRTVMLNSSLSVPEKPINSMYALQSKEWDNDLS